MFHLPNDKHVCPSCKKDWYAEYDADEKIVCPYCNLVIQDIAIIIKEVKRPKRR